MSEKYSIIDIYQIKASMKNLLIFITFCFLLSSCSNKNCDSLIQKRLEIELFRSNQNVSFEFEDTSLSIVESVPDQSHVQYFIYDSLSNRLICDFSHFCNKRDSKYGIEINGINNIYSFGFIIETIEGDNDCLNCDITGINSIANNEIIKTTDGFLIKIEL